MEGGGVKPSRVESCLRCYFFVPSVILVAGESLESAGKRGQEENGYAGFCHRYPPTHEMDSEISDQGNLPPSVNDDAWCGEFRSENV